MGALNIPSAADIERLTRRLRSVSLRLEGIEEGVDRLEGAIAQPAAERSDVAERLSAIESQLGQLTDTVDRIVTLQGAAKATKAGKAAKRPAKA
jgi:chromosome segregation ATPase